MQSSSRRWIWPPSRDLLAVAIVAGIAVLGWCAANDKWTTRSLTYPSTYLDDPERSDFFSGAAYVKASDNWLALPILWKTVPQLGAPYDGNWNDFPSLDEVVLGIQAVLVKGLGLFAGLNVSFALAHALAAAAFYLSARLSACNRLWSFVGALAFGVAPYVFAQSPHHMQVAYVWPVAFFPLVWRWCASDAFDAGVPSPDRRRALWGAVGIAFVSGIHFVYYTNVLCQLVLVTSLIRCWQRRCWEPLRPAMAIIAAAAAGFAIMNIDSWTYRLFHEPNANSFVREYKWLELYGLKLKDLFIPPMNHRSEAFAAFSQAHWKAAPLLDERASYLGILGIGSLLWLVFTGLRAMIERRERDVPPEVWQILWVVLMFTTGGLNAVIGSAGITMFRAGCRYSVVILVISLLWAARRMTAIQARSEASHPGEATAWQWYAVGSAIAMMVLWDQVPRPPTAAETASIIRQVDSDRAFTAKMEATLPEGAMVFQLPIMEYPESPAPGVPPYDHFRPYLYSTKLRYSFGSMKGRPRENWQRELGQRPLEEAVAEIEKRGFAAIYVNRNGFPERAQPIEKALRAMGYRKPPIVSDTGDLVCIPLEKP